MKQYKKRNMYLNDLNEEFIEVYSYDTLIGYIDKFDKRFYTWGYGAYSVTTSKQITMLVREQHLTLIKGRKREICDLIDHYSKLL